MSVCSRTYLENHNTSKLRGIFCTVAVVRSFSDDNIRFIVQSPCPDVVMLSGIVIKTLLTGVQFTTPDATRQTASQNLGPFCCVLSGGVKWAL